MATARRLAANIAVGTFSNVFRILVNLAMLPIMARLLGPEENGLYLLALPLVQYTLIVSDGGLIESLAREKDDRGPSWSTAFWTLLFGSCVMGAGLYALSIFVGHAANQPRLPPIMAVLAACLPIMVMGIIPAARLLRSGRLVTMSLADMTANFTGAALGVFLAFQGAGVWAMVVMYVTMHAVRTSIAFLAAPFWPRMIYKPRALLALWAVGGGVMGGRVLDLTTVLFERALVSRFLGPAPLGHFGIATQVGRFFTDAAGTPTWTTLYFKSINTPDAATAAYQRFVRLFALVMMPGAALLAAAVPTIVPLLFGQEWLGAIHPMMAIVVGHPFMSLAMLFGAVTLSQGRSRAVLLTTLGQCSARLALVFVLIPFGVAAVAIGIAAISVLTFVTSVAIVSPSIGVQAGAVYRAVLAPVLGAIVAYATTHFMAGPSPTLLWLCVSGLAGLAAYLTTLLVIDRKALVKDAQDAMGLVFRRGAPAPAAAGE